jgi:hypothetical protein
MMKGKILNFKNRKEKMKEAVAYLCDAIYRLSSDIYTEINMLVQDVEKKSGILPADKVKEIIILYYNDNEEELLRKGKAIGKYSIDKYGIDVILAVWPGCREQLKKLQNEKQIPIHFNLVDEYLKEFDKKPETKIEN